MLWCMYRIGRILLLCALPSWAQADCPPLPDRTAETEAILLELKSAKTEMDGRRLSNDLWAIWTVAPDAEAQALLDAGMARRESYDYLGAIEQFDALVAYCPDYAEGYNQRAFARFLREEYVEALADLERALALNPRHTGALSGMALTLMGLGRMRTAQDVLRDALELNPWLPERAYLIEPPGKDI